MSLRLGFSGFIWEGVLAMNLGEDFPLVVYLWRSLILALGLVAYLLKSTPTSEAFVCTWWGGCSY